MHSGKVERVRLQPAALYFMEVDKPGGFDAGRSPDLHQLRRFKEEPALSNEGHSEK